MSKAVTVAEELEEAFRRSMPSGKRKLGQAEWTNAIGKFLGVATEIRSRHRLGVIGRARAAYLLQQRLSAGGLPADVVRKVVFALVVNSFSGKG